MDISGVFLSGILSVVLFTCFVKVLTTLSILRIGLSLQSSGFGIVILLLSFAMSLLIVSPQIDASGGLTAFFNGKSEITQNLETSFRPFLEKNTKPEYTQKLENIVSKIHAGKAEGNDSGAPNEKNASFTVLTCAFLITEISQAFQLGLILLIPLLVIDLIVVNIMMLLGTTQISSELVSLPLKILLFFAVDGWGLITEKIFNTYT